MPNTELVTIGRPYSYQDYITDTVHLIAAYPGALRYFRIGFSADRREIGMFRIGTGTRKILLTAGVHGRECINTPVLMKMIELYAWMLREHSWLDYRRMDQFFEKNSFYFIPLVNPDGYEIARAGFAVLRNAGLRTLCARQQVPFSEWKRNGRAVDINRNFPAVSYRKKTARDQPGSEPETQALMRVMSGEGFSGYLDFHCRGKEIYYYRSALSESYNENQRRYAQALKQVCGYDLVKPEEELEGQVYGGNTVHYFSERLNKSAITIETVEDEEEFPLQPKLQSEAFEESWYLPFKYADLIF